MTTQLRRTTSAALGATAILALALVPSGSALAAPVPVGTPPVAVITVPSTAWAGVPITLSAAKSTSSGAGISEWEWDLDNNGRFERDSLSTSWVSKAFSRGKHTVKLRVRNGSGLVDTATKTFTVKKPTAAAVEPIAPSTVTAAADGTAVDVTWEAPLGAPVLAYQVTNSPDADADPIYVPSTEELQTRFDGLVPGDYRIRVAAINAAGTGPGSEANAQVVPKGGPSSSASATAATGATSSATPTSTASVSSDPTVAPTTGTTNASGSSNNNNDTIGIVLIAVGGVVLVGAGVTAGITAWRRRRAA